jgi:hypothetical protein
MSGAGALLLLAVLVAFGFLVVASMLFVFALVTGWTALARRYPARLAFEGERYRMRGVVLGTWGWSAPPLWAGLDDTGIVLRAVAPFALAFRPIHLPWAAIEAVTHREYMFFDVVELRYGKRAQAVIGFVESRGGEGPPAAPGPGENVLSLRVLLCDRFRRMQGVNCDTRDRS